MSAGAAGDVGARCGREGRPAPLVVLLAVLLATGAGVHGTLVPDHARESALLGLSFAVWGALQLAAAILLLLRPSRRTCLAIAWGSAAAVGAWAATRVFGLPFGSDTWQPEGVGIVDGVTSLFGAGAAGVALLLATGREGAGDRVVTAAAWTCGGVGVALLSLAGSHAAGGAHSEEAGHLGGHLAHAALILMAVLSVPIVGRAAKRRRPGRGSEVNAPLRSPVERSARAVNGIDRRPATGLR